MSFPMMTQARRRLAAFGAGLLFVALATWEVTVCHRSLYWGDVMLYFLPAVECLRRELLSGRLALWNPYVLCGQPFIGNPQNSVLYPTTALLSAFSGAAFLGINAVVHVAVAWAGTYRYSRWLKTSRSAAVLCASTFAGSAAFLGRLQFPTMVQAMAWMPWIVLLSSRLGRTPDAVRFLSLAGVLALSIYSGHAQVTYLSLLVASAVVLAAPRAPRATVAATIAAIVRAYGWWLAALVGGIVLSAGYWLPVADVVRLSARPELPLLKADRFTVDWTHLAALVWPGFAGNARSGDYWASGNMWEPAVFVGFVPLALALAGAWTVRRSGAARLHTGIAIASLWLAGGVWGGLYWLAYYALPGMAAFHDPARFGITASLGLAVLAALGLDEARLPRWMPRPLLAAAGVATLLPWTARLTPTVDPSELAYRPRILALGSAERFYTPFRQDVWDRYVSYREYGPESGRYVHELTDTVLPNIGMRYGLAETGGYEPVPIKWAIQLEALMRDAALRQSASFTHLARITNTRYVLLPVGSWIRHPDLAHVSGLPSVAHVSWGPRSSVRLVSHVRVIPDTERAMDALSRASSERDWAIVSAPVDLGDHASEQGGNGIATPALRWRNDQSLIIDLGIVSLGSVAITPITYMPGWKARVDGRPTPTVRADGAFLAAVAPAGGHILSLEYQPDAFRLGMYITVASCGLLAFATGVAAHRRLARRARQVH